MSDFYTYDHRTLKIRLPVRSAIYKQCTGGLVVRWVTTSESPLLYVFDLLPYKRSVLIVAYASIFAPFRGSWVAGLLTIRLVQCHSLWLFTQALRRIAKSNKQSLSPLVLCMWLHNHPSQTGRMHKRSERRVTSKDHSGSKLHVPSLLDHANPPVCRLCVCCFKHSGRA